MCHVEFSEVDSPLTRLEGSEGLQSLVHPGKIPEPNIIIIPAGHQTGSRGIQAKSRYLMRQSAYLKLEDDLLASTAQSTSSCGGSKINRCQYLKFVHV